MIRYLATAAVSAALAAGGVWQYQTNRYERVLSEQRTEYATAQARALERANAETERLRATTEAAARKAAIRSAALDHDVDAVRAESRRLRDDLATASSRLPTSSCDSTRSYAAAVTDVLGAVEAEGGRMAEKADRHAVDSMRCDR